jgi:hypothetical protein
MALGPSFCVSLLLGVGFGFCFQLPQLAIQLRNCRLKLGDFASRSSEIALGGGDLGLRLAAQPGQRLLKKLDIGLQASGTTLHLLFGHASFQPADVLCNRGRQQRREQDRCTEQSRP